MSALVEIQTMIEERVAREPALAGTFHDLYQRVVTLKAAEQQLEKDHHDLQQAYKDLFVQYSAQTGELARLKQEEGRDDVPPGCKLIDMVKLRRPDGSVSFKPVYQHVFAHA
jgi:hypothetical protein